MNAHHGKVEHRGCSLAYTLQGQGPPLVMIPGTGIYRSGCQPQLRGLSHHFTCLAIDNRGTGDSQPPGDTLSVPQMADDTLAIMDSLGWRSAHIAGVSLGGLVAQHLAIHSRDRVSGLALICTFPSGWSALRPRPKLLSVGTRARFGTRPSRRRAVLEVVLPEHLIRARNVPELAAEWAEIIGHDLAWLPPVTMRQVGAMLACDFSSRLRELQGLRPLIINAGHDWIAPPATGRAMAAGIPDSRHVVFHEAGHGVTIQCAEAVNQLLIEHFDA